MRRHLAGAILAGLALRLFFVWRFPFEAGDTKIYEELARNWLDHGVYGLFVNGQLTPVDLRAPGYPAFLAALYAVFGQTRVAVMLAQATLDLGTCVVTALLAASLALLAAPRAPASARAAAAALWLAALCPFVANYCAVPLTEVLATFLTAVALVLLLRAYLEPAGNIRGRELAGGQGEFLSRARRLDAAGSRRWFFSGLVVGLATLVRPESPLLLISTGLVLSLRWRRRADWSKLVRAGVWMAAGLLLPLLPWAARNQLTLGRAQFLAPRYAEMPGEFVPRGFYAWTRTWLVRYRDVYLSVWKIEDEPIEVESLPATAFDSDQERARVAALLAEYNESLDVTPALDAGFARLAAERTSRNPLRTYLSVPAERAATMWLTPRVDLLPYTGELGPLGQKWEEDREDFLVSVGLGTLNLAYLGLALAGLWRGRHQPAVALLASFLVVRTAFLTRVEAPEPRYVLVCFPAVIALAALCWAEPPEEPGAAPAGTARAPAPATAPAPEPATSENLDRP